MSKCQSISLVLLLLTLVNRSAVQAQSYLGYEQISTAQGLSQGLINDMIQDKEGFIWIATKSGLNRYDGYEFKVFTASSHNINSISSNSVSNLLEDRLGRIWVGTYDSGVNIYDKKTGRFTRISYSADAPRGLSGNRIESAMLELPDGRILICPKGASMSLVSLSEDLNKEPTITRIIAPGNREIVGIGKDDKGFIWLGCTDESIFIFSPSSATFEMLSDGRTFTNMIEKIGTQLSARSSQVFFTHPTPRTPFRLQNANGQLRPVSIQSKPNGDIILNGRFPIRKGSVGSLFYDFSALKGGSGVDEAKSIYLESFDNEHTIKCMLLDRSGVLWVGMLGQGLYKYRVGSQLFKPILPNLSVQRIALLDKKTVYVQGWRAISAVTLDGLQSANPLNSIIGEPVGTNVLQAKNGDYWIYNRDSLKLDRYSSNFKLLKTYLKPVSPKSTDHIQPTLEDRSQHIWICGTNGSLARIDQETGLLQRFVLPTDQVSGTSDRLQTNAFYEDASGVFWMGTEHGFARLVFKYDHFSEVKWFKNIRGNRNSLNYNYVSCFMDDPVNSDYLWISTQGGGLNLMQKSTGKFMHYTVSKGLPNNVVYGTLADNEGNIWGSTNRGLFCIISSSLKANNKPAIRLFGTGDGLQADEFNTGAYTKLPNGHLVFGGVNGVNIFNPKKILAGSFKPNTFITGIQIGNKLLEPGDKTGILKGTIELTRSITLSHLQDVVTLEFSSLDFNAPEHNKYRYQLIGIDKEWVESGTRRTATYLHLPPGDYVFKVQGSNSQGIWSSHITSLNISVLPPWWLSWWAYSSYALIVAFSIRGYLKFNVNKARLQSQLVYEQLEAKRMKDLDVIKTQLYTNITHEFRTPLTVILGMAQQVIEKPEEQFETRMEMIVRNGRSLLKLVNQMLDLSKLENGKMLLQLSSGDIIRFLRYVVESFHSLAGHENKQLHFLTDMESLYIEYDQEKMRQIISNLISNAIKFTPVMGNVYLSVSEQTQFGSTKLIIKVKDTGIGIPSDQLDLIFERFYQLGNNNAYKTEGTGIGLALTKELVKLMQGEIIAKSPPTGANKGAEFTVAIPFNRINTVTENMHECLNNPPGSVIAIPTLSYAMPVMPDEGSDPKVPLILLVEDNADVLAYTASCLPNYRLAVGTDGREGFDTAINLIPDLIITDVMMPFVDGFELLNKLRANENTSHIPIIMLTAKADLSSKIEGLREGADVYLDKPFNKEELIVRISKLLEMRNNLRQYYLKKAGIHLDTVPEAQGFLLDKINSERKEDAFVKRVRAAVTQNLSDVTFTVEQLSRLVFMSHSQLHRKLEALTGCSPNRFIRMIRLKKARELLKDPYNSISSVAMECGYDDPAYFTRVFKQEFGVTPQKWRSSIG